MPMKRRPQPQSRATKKPKTDAPSRRAKAAQPTRASKPAKAAKPTRAVKQTKPVKTAKPTKATKPAAPTRTKKQSKPVAPTTPVSARKTATKPAPKPAARQGHARTAPVVAGPSSHDLAVDAFERGFQALQQRQFARAAVLLSAVVNNFSDEKEMQERARVYLTICERQVGVKESKPRSFEDRLSLATIAVNRGAFDEALVLFRKLESEDPGNDHVQYMLSVTCASLGDIAQALVHLRNAIEIAPENRLRATQDVDLEPLRQDPGYAALADIVARRRKVAAKKR
jgi:Flp pilus assembly protein TadD